VRLREAIYVLHVFQNRSKHGRATPKRDLEVIRARLRGGDAAVGRRTERLTMPRTRRIAVVEGSGNVFADVGIEDADEYLAKAELARQIIGALDARGLSQTRAATVLGVSQPNISALRNGHLDGFSAERLIRFLNALGRDVKITVSVKPRTRRRARLTVQAA
jgi:predicted XRE-type DNA-binding protein